MSNNNRLSVFLSIPFSESLSTVIAQSAQVVKQALMLKVVKSLGVFKTHFNEHLSFVIQSYTWLIANLYLRSHYLWCCCNLTRFHKASIVPLLVLGSWLNFWKSSIGFVAWTKAFYGCTYTMGHFLSNFVS